MDRDRVKAAFQAAVEAAPDHRAGILAGCGLTGEEQREVTSLLAAHDAAGTFMQQATGGGWFAAAAGDIDGPSLLGSLVGPYRLVSLVGTGGMGTVFHGVRTGEFELHVAVKLIKRGMDSHEVLRRFRQERQTLARLEHPNIAKLLDGGSTETGQPYLVMELIRGERVDRYCDRMALSLRERVELVRTVGDAVRHAHQQLVVHRDIKPDNILVADDGVPKLVDFGIARLLASDSDIVDATRLAERRLTLAYASPEHVRGEPVSTAIDVYSLGVVLYELVTGTSPYIHAVTTTAEYDAALRAGVIPPSRRLTGTAARQIGGDLETIIMKALAPDAARRYASVEQLTDDLGRFLQARPITARPDTLGYRVSKFVRRNRAGAVAGLAVLLATVGGVGGVVWQSRIARAERDRAQQEARRGERITAFMVGVLGDADPLQSGRTITVAEALDGAVTRAHEELAGDPVDLASLLGIIGKTYYQLGRIEPALVQLSRSVELHAQHSPGSADHIERLINLSNVEESESRLPDAERHAREALLLAERAYPPSHPVVTGAMKQVGSVLIAAGRLPEAEVNNREVIARVRLGGSDPSSLAPALNNLGVVLGTMGKWDDAVPIQQEALVLIENLRGPKHPEVASALTTLATALEASHRYAEAEPLHKRAIALREELLGPDHPATAWARYAYAFLLIEMKQFDRAEPLIVRVLSLRGTALPDDHPVVAASLLQSGRIAMAAGRFDDALKDFREGVRLRTAVLPPGHWLLASGEGYIGDALTKLGRFDEAQSVLQRSYAGLKAALGESDKRTVEARAKLDQLRSLRAR